MKMLTILRYGPHGNFKLSPEERYWANWAFVVLLTLSLGGALWTYYSWKKKRE